MKASTSIPPQPHPTTLKSTLGLLLGILLVALCLRAPITGVGPLLQEIQQSLGLSNAMAGAVTTVPLLAFGVFSVFAPMLARRFGVERVIFAATVLLVGGIFLRSMGGMTLLFVGTTILSLGIALGNVLLPGIVKHHFALKIGLVTAIYSLGMNIVGAISSGISVPLSQNLGWGWQGALMSWLVIALLALVGWLPQLKRVQKPVATSLNAEGQPGSEAKAEAKAKPRVNLWRSRLAWQVTLLMGLQSLVFYTLLSWLPHILAEQGIDPVHAGLMLTTIQLALLPVAFIVPIVAGKMKEQKYLVLGSAVCMVLSVLGLLSGLSSLNILWMVFMGIGLGGCFSLSMMFFSLRTHNIDEASGLSGMAQSVGYLLAAFGPVVFGWVHDVTGGWAASLWLVLVVIAIMALAGWRAGHDVKVS
ncbi:MAG: MFS transporter [Neisseriaceae bacterium]|nr:MFS transporter [Neisseriaceae bacterium]